MQRNESLAEWDRIIIGIDPGTNVMGYGILGVKGSKPAMIAMGVIKLNKFDSHYLRAWPHIQPCHGHNRAVSPRRDGNRGPFLRQNVQSMLKLGRAQGVAMAAAISRDISITEYEPRKIKMAITGNGAAAKEQVQDMLRRILNIPAENLLPELDATDALGAALCHFYESGKARDCTRPSLVEGIYCEKS